MVNLVYDTIEAARRRSLRELWLAGGADEAESDGEILRERILGYLTEGDIARWVEELAERAPFAFDDWKRAWTAMGAPNDERGEPSFSDSSPDDVTGILVSESDTREWLFAAARLLGSYPDHPGLLASRGLAEAMLPGGNLHEFEQNLVHSQARAQDSYGIGLDDVEQFFFWLLRLLTGDTGDRAVDGAAQAALERVQLSPSDLASGVERIAHSAGAATSAVDDWLDDNWGRGAELAALKLPVCLEFANRLALTAITRFGRDSNGRI